LEERDLKRWTIQALGFASYWWDIPQCKPVKNGSNIPKLASAYKEHAGQTIEMGIVFSEKKLIVYFDVLHVYLSFSRLHNVGLSPPEINGFCEESYDQHLVAQDIEEQRLKSVREKIMDKVHSNPVMNQIDQELFGGRSCTEEQQIERREVRQIRIPAGVQMPDQPMSSWSDEKGALFGKLLDIVESEVRENYCNSGGKVKVTIPTFDVGDPCIYVLIELPDPNAVFLLWIEFLRDPISGLFGVEVNKEIGLPEEVAFWAPRVRQKALRQLVLGCPEIRH
jgi:hypothetical protein